MVKIVYWSLLTKVGSLIVQSPKKCVNIGAGIVCGVAQAFGAEVFTGDSVNQALGLKSASDACLDELPISIPTGDHDQVAGIMKAGGKAAIAEAQAVMKSAGVGEKCIAIFGLVCSKAEQSGALDIIKQACANLWV